MQRGLFTHNRHRFGTGHNHVWGRGVTEDCVDVAKNGSEHHRSDRFAWRYQSCNIVRIGLLSSKQTHEPAERVFVSLCSRRPTPPVPTSRHCLKTLSRR